MDDLDAWIDAVVIGARTPGPVTLVPYDPAWPEVFGEHRARIAAALGPVARRIDHVGSTSVPGLAAKPIVDIQVAVDDPDDEAAFHDALVGCGYELRVREPRHRMYRTASVSVQVHLWTAGSDDVDRHLRFRDRLRASAADRALYEQAKRELAARDWPDVNHYAHAKSAVIAEILARAA